MTFTPNTVFAAAEKAGASDVHIAVGSQLLFRIARSTHSSGQCIVNKDTSRELHSYCTWYRTVEDI